MMANPERATDDSSLRARRFCSGWRRDRGDAYERALPADTDAKMEPGQTHFKSSA